MVGANDAEVRPGKSWQDQPVEALRWDKNGFAPGNCSAKPFCHPIRRLRAYVKGILGDESFQAPVAAQVGRCCPKDPFQKLKVNHTSQPREPSERGIT